MNAIIIALKLAFAFLFSLGACTQFTEFDKSGNTKYGSFFCGICMVFAFGTLLCSAIGVL